jgi:hypothetical protein
LAVFFLLILFSVYLQKDLPFSSKASFLLAECNFLLLRGYLLKFLVSLFFCDLLFPHFGYASRNGEISSEDPGVDADGPAGTFSSEALDARGLSV